jgi:hypothetical protein
MKKLLLGALLLLSSFACMSQEFYYEDCLLRDNLGHFKSLNKSGYFEIENDSMCLFDQRLEIISWRVVFDKKSVHTGKMYTCSDGTYYYTLYLTVNNELFFYTKEEEMIKFILKPTKDEKILSMLLDRA